MTSIPARARLSLVATLLCAALTSVNAGVILSNLPGTSAFGSNLGLGPDSVDRTKGVGLTMGATAMDFQSIDALISNSSPDSVLSGGIFSSVGSNPGLLLAAFASTNIGSNFGPAEVSLMATSAFQLAANTSYWFVLDGPATDNFLFWEGMTTAPTATGATYDGYRFSADGGASWGSSGIFNGVRINTVASVPEPGSLALVFGGLGLLCLRRRS